MVSKWRGTPCNGTATFNRVGEKISKPLAGEQMEKAKADALISINNLGFVTTLRD